MEVGMETAAAVAANPAPSWALRVPRPAGAWHRMAQGLEGVPKPALQTIFGESLGRRIWQQPRTKTATAGPAPKDRVSDAEISAGMLAYAAKQAADALRKSGRQAKALNVSITFADREARSARSPLARPTNDSNDIIEAAVKLLSRIGIRDVAQASIRLGISSVESSGLQGTEKLWAAGCRCHKSRRDRKSTRLNS